MLELDLLEYSFYYKGHPVYISITDEHQNISSPVVRQYYDDKLKRDRRISLLTKSLLAVIILSCAITVCAYALSAIL